MLVEVPLVIPLADEVIVPDRDVVVPVPDKVDGKRRSRGAGPVLVNNYCFRARVQD